MDVLPPGPWRVSDSPIGYRITAADGMTLAWVHWEEGEALLLIRGALNQAQAAMTARWLASLPDRLRPHSDPPRRRARIFSPHLRVGRSARSFKVEDINYRKLCSVPYRDPPRPGHFTFQQAEEFAWWLCHAQERYEAHRILDHATFREGWPGYS